jgi:hypothetical protein
MSSARYLSLLMSSRNQAHTLHLLTTSFAKHKALQDYYEGIVPLLDEWAEAYMGKYGRFPTVKLAKRTLMDPKQSTKYFRGLLVSLRKLKLPKDTYLQNIQDEIVALIRSTLYKLTLK